MSLHLFSVVLICLFSSLGIANENTKLATGLFSNETQGFVLIPMNLCKENKFRSLCSSVKFPASAKGRLLEVQSTEQGLAYFAPSNGPEDDHFELLCYRCALGKVAESTCGRYKPIYKKENWVKKCPDAQ